MDQSTLERCAALQVEIAQHYPKAMDLDDLREVADRLFMQLHLGNAGVVTFAPGNASQITLVVTDLGAIGRNTLGGRYLVAIPNFNPARLGVMSLDWEPDPRDLQAGDLRLSSGDAPFVAIVLSILAARLRDS